MSFVRPIGGRSISVSGGNGLLPWEAWKLLTDSTRISKLWGDHVRMPTKKGETGLFVDVARDFQITWPVEADQVSEGSLLKLIVIGNPWHHRPDLVNSTITMKAGDCLSLEMDGFDLTHLGDPSYFFASSWALSRLSLVVKALGGNPEMVSGTRAIWAQSSFQIQPDILRSKILDADQAIGWLGDEVDIEARLGGRFNLKWSRSWGMTSIEGNITKFEPDEIIIKIAQNWLGSNDEGYYKFKMHQSGSETKLVVSMDGFDIEPWANIPLMLMSEMIQLQLASLSIELEGSQNLEPA